MACYLNWWEKLLCTWYVARPTKFTSTSLVTWNCNSSAFFEFFSVALSYTSMIDVEQLFNLNLHRCIDICKTKFTLVRDGEPKVSFRCQYLGGLSEWRDNTPMMLLVQWASKFGLGVLIISARGAEWSAILNGLNSWCFIESSYRT